MAVREKTKKVTFRSVNNWLHLWLGLFSGLIMIVVCVMACVWVFEREITDLILPRKEKQYIVASGGAITTPSRILQIADSLYPNDYVRSIEYERDKPISFHIDVAVTDTSKKTERFQGLVHPYTGLYLGEVEKLSVDEERRMKSIRDFFGWALRGHRFLWLPWKVGRPIVNYATLIFTITLISGLVWWYPKKWTKSTREKSFKVKWKAGWKRVNLDLHNVFGFYALIFLLAITLSGMVYGIEWHSKALFWTTNLKPLRDWKPQRSDSTKMDQSISLSAILDENMSDVISKHRDFVKFTAYMPDTTRVDATIDVSAQKHLDRYYANHWYVFDRYTGERIPNSNAFYDRSFEESTVGEQIRRLNYDIHVGSVLGLPTKILAFFASLIGASLPITGFIVWYNRKWGKKKGSRKKPSDKKLTVSADAVSDTIAVNKAPIRLRNVGPKIDVDKI